MTVLLRRSGTTCGGPGNGTNSGSISAISGTADATTVRTHVSVFFHAPS